jgi:hypothetical protein
VYQSSNSRIFPIFTFSVALSNCPIIIYVAGTVIEVLISALPCLIIVPDFLARRIDGNVNLDCFF